MELNERLGEMQNRARSIGPFCLATYDPSRPQYNRVTLHEGKPSEPTWYFYGQLANPSREDYDKPAVLFISDRHTVHFRGKAGECPTDLALKCLIAEVEGHYSDSYLSLATPRNIVALLGNTNAEAE